MKIYPYSSIKTVNLGPLLFAEQDQDDEMITNLKPNQGPQ